jgi:hypothetical protein
MPASITPALQMIPGDVFTLTYNPIQMSSGGPAQLAPGITPAWSVDNTTAIGLSPTVDGMRCLVLAKAQGNATITCTARGVAPLPADVIATVSVTTNPVLLPPCDQAFLTATVPMVPVQLPPPGPPVLTVVPVLPPGPFLAP